MAERAARLGGGVRIQAQVVKRGVMRRLVDGIRGPFGRAQKRLVALRGEILLARPYSYASHELFVLVLSSL